VTGGGAGIGEAICRRLARDGLAVGVLGTRAAAVETLAKEIQDAGGRALGVEADVSDRSQLDAAVAELRRRFGRITVLVNNAGVESFTPFLEIADPDWDRLMSVNLKGPYIATQAVLPDMLAAGWGRIVNITALGAQSGAPHMAHYTASKGGLMALTKSLAVELGARGVTVNAIAPGFILTPMSRRAMDAGLFAVPYEEILKSYPIPRIGRPEEVAAACAYFVSEDAGYVTGQLLGVNGGAYM
jgi:NAD(P)-dependent dehydrogenase (short-subunit alcohol dehydrogenase family)